MSCSDSYVGVSSRTAQAAGICGDSVRVSGGWRAGTLSGRDSFGASTTMKRRRRIRQLNEHERDGFARGSSGERAGPRRVSLMAVIAAMWAPRGAVPPALAFAPSAGIQRASRCQNLGGDDDRWQLFSSVRKRVGSHDCSSGNAPANAISKPANAISKPARKTARAKPAVAARRQSNVFDQFTPSYIASPFDVDVLQDSIPNNIPNSNNNQLNSRIAALLKDDTGEQDLPDDSPEAANQIADRRAYSKMSEEARRKANFAVSSNSLAQRDTAKPLAQPSHTAATAKKRRMVRATVKETGSDSISTYIKSLGQHELLYKQDEIVLGRQIRLLSRLEEQRQALEHELLHPPTFAQWARATNHTVPSLKQQIRRSQRAKAALIEANLRLVITVARQAVKKSSKSTASSIQFQDACQQGIIGLTRASEKFDPELGYRFSTYAIWWIQKEVTKNVSEQARAVRLPSNAIKKINDIRIQERILINELGRRPNDDEVANKLGMTVEKLNFYRQSAKSVSSLDKSIESRKGKGSSSSGGMDSDGNTMMDVFIHDKEHPSPTDLVNEQMMKEDIRKLVKTLSPREQAVIRLRFGLDDGKPQTLRDIGERFGVEKEKIKKIEARALLKLRQPSRSSVVRCYVSDHT